MVKKEEEHNAALMFINNLGDDLPDGWSCRYDANHQRYCYINASKNIHFWSTNVSNPNLSGSEEELEDLHPDQYE